MARKPGFGTGLIRPEIRKGKIEMKSKKQVKKRQAKRRSEKQRYERIKNEQIKGIRIQTDQWDEQVLKGIEDYCTKKKKSEDLKRKLRAKFTAWKKKTFNANSSLMKSRIQWKDDFSNELIWVNDGKLNSISFNYSTQRDDVDHLLKLAESLGEVMKSDFVFLYTLMRKNSCQLWFQCDFETSVKWGEHAMAYHFVNVGALLKRHGIIIHPMFLKKNDSKEMQELVIKEMKNAA